MVEDEALAEQIRRRSQELVHVDRSAEMPPMDGPPSGAFLEMQMRANAMAARRAERESLEGSTSEAPSGGLSTDPSPSSTQEVHQEPTPASDIATARSEAAMARARARARARADASVLRAAPVQEAVSVSNQQAWLMAAMGAASEQEYAPIDVQQDWLMQAVEQIPDDNQDPFLNLPLAPAPAPAALSPRSLFNLSPRRHSRTGLSPRPTESQAGQGDALSSPRSPRLSPRLGVPSFPRRGCLSPRGPCESAPAASAPAPAATPSFPTRAQAEASRELFPEPAGDVNENHLYV